MTSPNQSLVRRSPNRRADDMPSSVVAELPHRRQVHYAVITADGLSSMSLRVEIGRRWVPGHFILRDPITGFYEERNPPMTSEAENVQSALICPRRIDYGRRWAMAMLLPLAVYLFCRVVWPAAH